MIYDRFMRHIPKNLFTYWGGSERPAFVEACMHRMQEINPTWRFQCITDDDMCGTLPCLTSLSVQHRSDWARCCALFMHGGVWLDASVLCARPLESWVDCSSNSVQGFSTPFDKTILENWAFAAPQQSAFIAEWKSELQTACEMGADAYCQAIPARIVPDSLRDFLPYLTMHAAFCVASDRRPGLAIVMRPSAAVNGPFHYLQTNEWDSSRAVADISSASRRNFYSQAFLFKLRGAERQALHDRNHPIDDASPLGEVMLAHEAIREHAHARYCADTWRGPMR